MAAVAAKGTILITGANGALGSAIAEQIASKPELSAYHGLYTVRDASSAPALNSALAHGLPSHAYDILSLELTNLDVVRRVAGDINTRVSSGQIPPIRALVLNAGFLDFGKQAWTDNGLDVTFAANYLGHWVLTLLLLRSMDPETGHIIVIGSYSHDPNDKRNVITKAFVEERYKTVIDDEARFDAIAKGEWSSAKEDSSYRSGFRRYGASKLYLIMMIYELRRRMDQEPALKNIQISGIDPGGMVSGLQRLAPWHIRFFYVCIIPVMVFLNPNGSIRPPQRSAADVLELAMNSNAALKDLYFDGRQPHEPCVEAQDIQKRKLVWSETVKYAQLKEGDTILGDWQ